MNKFLSFFLMIVFFSVSYDVLAIRSNKVGPGKTFNSGSGGVKLNAFTLTNLNPQDLPDPGSGTYTSTTPTVCTVSGTSLTKIGVGSCTITLQADGSTFSRTFEIPGENQAALTFSLSNFNMSGNTATLPAATGGSGAGAISYASNSLLICSVSGNTVTKIAAGTCSITATKAAHGVYGSVSATSSFEINPAPQPAIVTTLSSSAIYVGDSVTIATSGGHGNVVNHTSETPSVCSISAGSNSLVALTTGICTIRSTKPQNGLYAEGYVLKTVTISDPALIFSLPSTFTGLSISFNSASGGNGGTISYASTTPNVCTVSGTTLTKTGVGTCTVTATQGSQVATASILNVPSEAQSALNFSISGLSFSGSTATITAASGGSGTASVTYAHTTPAVCTVSGTTVTKVSSGTCTITATKPASGPYAALSVSSSINLGPNWQHFSNDNPTPGNSNSQRPVSNSNRLTQKAAMEQQCTSLGAGWRLPSYSEAQTCGGTQNPASQTLCRQASHSIGPRYFFTNAGDIAYYNSSNLISSITLNTSYYSATSTVVQYTVNYNMCYLP